MPTSDLVGSCLCFSLGCSACDSSSFLVAVSEPHLSAEGSPPCSLRSPLHHFPPIPSLMSACFRSVVLKLECMGSHLEGLSNTVRWASPSPAFLTQQVLGGAQGYAFPANPQLLLLVVWGTHCENQCPGSSLGKSLLPAAGRSIP